MSFKIGFLNVYPYRPHAHQAKFLERLAKSLGWETYALVCDGNANRCYLRELKGTGRLECAKCIVGGLRTFAFDHVDSAGRYWSSNNILPEHEVFVESSAYTLTRIESWEQRQSQQVAEKKQVLLADSVNFYYAVQKWIAQRKLDAVIAFNGRMDMPRAAIEACNIAGIPYLTHERPLFGHGIILNRNTNCSSLEKIHWINKTFSAKPLTQLQCKIAAKLAADRLFGGNLLEWKNYNTNALKIDRWPVPKQNSDYKVLVCPSSKNELLGHPDWATEWKDNTDALDTAVAKKWFNYRDILIRFHPSWSINFGQVTAKQCEEHYLNWCKNRGVAFIQSSSNISTQELIRLADLVVLNGSNTIFEAGMLGKPVFCLGPSPYSYSGTAYDIIGFKDFDEINMNNVLNTAPKEIIRKTLRYFYSKAAREPIYTNFVRSKTVTECFFYDGANPLLLEELLHKKNHHIADDSEISTTCKDENIVLEAFENNVFEELMELKSFIWQTSAKNELKISRKLPYQIVDTLRNLYPKGV